MSALSSRLTLASCLAALSAAPLFTPARVEPSAARRSPETARIAFAAKRDADWNIYVMSADGGVLTRLTSRREQERFPLWSPDDRTIAYGVQTNHGWELWAMAADGSGARRRCD
jgi:Tol biopolymer transport system component